MNISNTFLSLINYQLFSTYLLPLTLCFTITNSYSMSTGEIIKTAIFEPSFDASAGDQTCEGYKNLWHEVIHGEFHPSIQEAHKKIREAVGTGLDICHTRKAELNKYKSYQKKYAQNSHNDLLTRPFHIWRTIQREANFKKGDAILVDAYNDNRAAFTHYSSLNQALNPSTSSMSNISSPEHNPKIIPNQEEFSFLPAPKTPLTHHTLPIPQELSRELAHKVKAGDNVCQGFFALYAKMLSHAFSGNQQEQQLHDNIDHGLNRCAIRKKIIADYQPDLDAPVDSDQWVANMTTGALVAGGDFPTEFLYLNAKDIFDMIEIPSQAQAIQKKATERNMAYDPTPGDRMCQELSQIQQELDSLPLIPVLEHKQSNVQKALINVLTTCNARQKKITLYQKIPNLKTRLKLKEEDAKLVPSYHQALISFLSYRARLESNNQNSPSS